MKKFLVIAAAAGALAVGVPAAIAATDSAETPPATTAQPVQDSQQQQERPDRGDCPEKNGGGEASNAPSGNEL